MDDRQSTYNVTLRSVPVTIVAVENQKSITYSECVCSLIYPECKAHAPYYIFICSLSGPTIFSTLSHKCHDFRKKKKVTEYKTRVLIFSTTFTWGVFNPKNNSARYYHKCTQVFNVQYPLNLLDSYKLEFSRQILEKYSTVKFHENPSSGSRVVPCGSTKRRTLRS